MIVNISNINHPVPKEVICFTNNNLLCRFSHKSVIGEKTIDWNAHYYFWDNTDYSVIRKGGLAFHEPVISVNGTEIGKYKYTFKLIYENAEYKFYPYYKRDIVYISIYLNEQLIGIIVKNNGQNVTNKIFDYTAYFEYEQHLKPLIFIATIFHEHIYQNFKIGLEETHRCYNPSSKGKKMLDLSYIDRIKALDGIIN